MKRNVLKGLGILWITSIVTSGCGSTNKSQVKNEVTKITEDQSSALEIKNIDEQTYMPVTINNYDLETTYETKPKSIITLSLNSAEIIAALGEADLICAIQTGNNLLTDVLPEYYEVLKEVDVPTDLNTGVPPTLEVMLNKGADFISMNAYYFYVPTFGSVEDYTGNHIRLYVTEGSYVDKCTMENTYNDIRNLGKILGKAEEAEGLINDMQLRLKAVTDKTLTAEPVKVMAFDSMSDNLYTIAGGSGLEQELIEMVGAENIFADIEQSFSTVSIEEIIERNPEYIIIHEYTTEENNAQSKIDYLMSQEELSGVKAIQNKQFIVVNLFQVTPGLQNVDFVEKVAKAIHADLFQ